MRMEEEGKRKGDVEEEVEVEGKKEERSEARVIL